MIKNKSNMGRIMLALTETCSLHELWRAAMEHLAEEGAELTTVFVRDDRWRRAASLPFTTEISRASGGSMDFTMQRAEQVDRDAVTQLMGRLQQLANDAEIQLAFKVLGEHEATRIHEYVTSESDLFIAPSFFKARPIYAELARLKCRILLVDSIEVTAGLEDH